MLHAVHCLTLIKGTNNETIHVSNCSYNSVSDHFIGISHSNLQYQTPFNLSYFYCFTVITPFEVYEHICE
jgi:hypothetical protein